MRHKPSSPHILAGFASIAFVFDADRMSAITTCEKQPKLRMSRREALGHLANQTKIGRAIKGQRIRDRWELDHARAEKQEWVRRASEVLESVFASSEGLVERFNDWSAPILPEYAELEMFIELFADELRHRLERLQEAQSLLAHAIEPSPIQPLPEASPAMDQLDNSTEDSPQPRRTQILLLHDGASAAGEAAHEFLTQLGLAAQRTAPASLTAAQLDEFSTTFAVFVTSTKKCDFALGWCVGRLGADRVCILSPPDAGEATPEHDTLHRIAMNTTEAWQLALARRMRSAGVKLDLNRLL